MAPSSHATLTIVGDVHNRWRAADVIHLERGKQDLVLFVGDLGDEDVDMVREIAALRAPKVVMLGNHDAWQSFGIRRPTPKLLESLDLLGNDHLAYTTREIPSAAVTLLGARPFSWGGQSLRSPELYDQLYGVRTMRQSAARIADAAREAMHRDIVVLAHNGPLGLGHDPRDIYGKDFGKPGGDWGDRDLALALQRLEQMGLRVPVVIAGHMHHKLVHKKGEERVRFVRRGQTLFVNPAVVPRIALDADDEEVGYLLRLRLAGGRLTGLEEIWIDGQGDVKTVREPEIVELAPAEAPIGEDSDES